VLMTSLKRPIMAAEKRIFVFSLEIQGSDVVVDEIQRYIVFLKSLMHNVLPDIVNVRMNGIQQIANSTIMQFVSRNLQRPVVVE